MTQFRGFGIEHQDDEAALESEGDKTSDRVREQVEKARASADDFSRAARQAIIESRWAREVRRRAERRSERPGADTARPA
jgi:hypothetical protein